MRAHLRVLIITMTAAAGWSGGAEGAPFVSRPLALSRSDWSLDLGLGLHHIRFANTENDYTGFGMNLEAAVGITSFVQLGLRTGVRFGNEGKASQADEFGRMFDFQTYGTRFDS